MMKMRFRRAQTAARDYSAVTPGDQSVWGSVAGEASPVLLLLPAEFWIAKVGSQRREQLVSGDRGTTGLPDFTSPIHGAPGSVGADARSSPHGLVGSGESRSSRAQADAGRHRPVPPERISHTTKPPGIRCADRPERSAARSGGPAARGTQMIGTVAPRSGSRGLPLLLLLLLLGSSCHMLHGQGKS